MIEDINRNIAIDNSNLRIIPVHLSISVKNWAWHAQGWLKSRPTVHWIQDEV